MPRWANGYSPATGNGWQTNAHELRLARGITFAARIDPVGAVLAGYLDGKRTVREAAAVFTAAYAIPAAPLLPQLPQMIRQLTELGVLLPQVAPEQAVRGD